MNYAWREYKDDIYACANSINSNKYAYNNLGAYYLTWYHKINEKWHFDTESWYQYERNVPSIFGTVPVENGANGAWCAAGEQTCFAPEWSVLNYVERKLGKKDTLSIRNEYFDDIKGQRTGYKDRYTEHEVSWNHWIGSSCASPAGDPLRTCLRQSCLRQRHEEKSVHRRRRHDLVLLVERAL